MAGAFGGGEDIFFCFSAAKNMRTVPRERSLTRTPCGMECLDFFFFYQIGLKRIHNTNLILYIIMKALKAPRRPDSIRVTGIKINAENLEKCAIYVKLIKYLFDSLTKILYAFIG
jgi:hypothetical protein